MKMLLNDFLELDANELIAVNGGAGNYPTVNSGSSSSSSVPYSGGVGYYHVASSNPFRADCDLIKEKVDTTKKHYINTKEECYMCDDWLEDVGEASGINMKLLMGAAASKNVEAHKKFLQDHGNIELSDSPEEDTTWSIVLMTDPKESLDSDFCHCGFLQHENGEYVFYQNTKKGCPPETYASVEAFEAMYLYNEFDYLGVSQ